jgi:glutaredoxin-related protein
MKYGRKWEMKVYGAEICIDCRNYLAIQKARGFEAEYIEITENTSNLKEFLQMRDTDPAFASVKENHGIGIPLFVREDGAKTFEIDEAFSWIGQPPVREEEIVEHRSSL